MNLPSDPQLDLLGRPDPQEAGHAGVRSLGLILNQRAWLQFLSSEWVFPEQGKQILLGINSLFGERPRDDETMVAIWFDRAKLPPVTVLARCVGQWIACPLRELSTEHRTIAWNGPLPLFAVERFSVATSEDKAHLLAMAASFQDMEVPEQPINVETIDIESAPKEHPVLTGAENPPTNWDALRGAAAMATWAVPAIDPWLNLLCEALEDRTPNQSASLVHASWWQTAPWARHSSTTLGDSLWAAMLSELALVKSLRELRPRTVLDGICVRAKNSGCDSSRLERIRVATTQLLDDRATIETAGLKDDLLGLALQLLLLRPSPERFVAWRDEWPAIPPAAWWTGATLSGYTSGFSALPKQFRGTQDARRVLAIRTWKLACSDGISVWDDVTREKIDWVRNADTIRLMSNGRPWAEHKISRRGRWYQLDFANESIRQRAEEVMREHCPGQLALRLVLNDAQVALLGDGSARIDAKRRILNVKGRVEIELGANVAVEKIFAADRFRDWLATASISEPLPRPVTSQKLQAVLPLGIAPELPSLSPAAAGASQTRNRSPRLGTSNVHGAVVPEGLSLRLDFISADEERFLLAEIDAHPWDTRMSRRVQHYGWQYDYKARKVDPSAYLGPLPDWLLVLAQRFVTQNIFKETPDQVIVNNYEGAQSISKHIDCIPCFRGPIVTISLNEAWEMVFTRQHESESDLKYKQLLTRRSAAVLDGEARMHWFHEIPKRMKEGSTKRGRRVSITFRKVAI